MDIDQISTDILWKIFDLIEEIAPEIKQGLAAAMQDTSRDSPKLARPAPKKKNKPMGKSEQDRKLEHLQGAIAGFEKSGSRSQEPMPCEYTSPRSACNANRQQPLNIKIQNPAVMTVPTLRRNKLLDPRVGPILMTVIPLFQHTYYDPTCTVHTHPPSIRLHEHFVDYYVSILTTLFPQHKNATASSTRTHLYWAIFRYQEGGVLGASEKASGSS